MTSNSNLQQQPVRWSHLKFMAQKLTINISASRKGFSGKTAHKVPAALIPVITEIDIYECVLVSSDLLAVRKVFHPLF